MMGLRRILITPGEPAGIGPDIVLSLIKQSFPIDLVVIADPKLIKARAKALGISLNLNECDIHQPPRKSTPAGTLNILPVTLESDATPQQLNPANASYVLRTLQLAASLCLEKKACGIVTGPVHKGVMNQAGIAFTGHTEFFADAAHVKQTVMLFVVDQLKVAIATTHLPLANVSKAITKERLKETLSILNQSLIQQFHLSSPRILVCGLNPHAGEGGYLGREEIDTITPVILELQKENPAIEGPLPADTIFTPHHLTKADAVLAMYHDQALPLVKYIGFGHAVNMTLGLPFVRTSVDHGTAIDIAGTGKADPGSMLKAIELAIALAPQASSD